MIASLIRDILCVTTCCVFHDSINHDSCRIPCGVPCLGRSIEASWSLGKIACFWLLITLTKPQLQSPGFLLHEISFCTPSPAYYPPLDSPCLAPCIFEAFLSLRLLFLLCLAVFCFCWRCRQATMLNIMRLRRRNRYLGARSSWQS